MGKNGRNTYRFRINETFIAQGNVHTSRGYLEFQGNPTVRDLVDWIMRTKDSWGYITIGTLFDPTAQAKHAHGMLTNSDTPNNPNVTLDGYLDRNIRTVRWSGGWGRDDFDISVK